MTSDDRPNSINGCPADEKLARILEQDKELDSGTVAHIGTCVVCKTRLDRLTEFETLEAFRHVAQKTDVHSSFARIIEKGKWSPPSIDRYAVESEIGKGGMGIVYRATDKTLGRPVAIKVLNGFHSPVAAARFERESQAASKLSHPNIVPVYTTGNADDGRPFLVMPLVKGESLKQTLSDGPIDATSAANWIMQIARGLEIAHQSGHVHRDIKPANILIDAIDELAKLVDFGLVRGEHDETLTRTEMICGTPEYMSPEQANHLESADARCDIYSLGITLYQCLTGTVPFRGQPLDVLKQHADEDPVPPTHLNLSVPRDLETICLKAIEKDPNHRYPTAADFADDLGRFIAGQPVLARPASVLEKTWRWSRRNPRVAILTTALASTLIGGILTTTLLWQRSQNNFVEAQSNLVAARENFDAATEMVINKREFAFRLTHTLGHELAARDLYRQVLEEVDKLVVLRNDDPAIRLLQPKVYLSNGEIEYMVGNTEDAISFFDKSELLFMEIEQQELHALENASSDVESDRYTTAIHHVRGHLVSVAISRGEAFHQIGRTDRALENYETAQGILVGLLRDDPSCGISQRNLALTLVLEGQVWSELGQNGKALDCFQAAYDSLPDKLTFKGIALTYEQSRDPDYLPAAESDPTFIDATEKHIYAYVSHFLGRHLVDTAKDSKDPVQQSKLGTSLLARSLEIRREIFAEIPILSRGRRDVGITLTELANAKLMAGQLDQANELVDEAVKILTAMVNRSSRHDLRLCLAQTLIVRSNLSELAENREQAMVDLGRAKELCETVLLVRPTWPQCKVELEFINERLSK